MVHISLQYQGRRYQLLTSISPFYTYSQTAYTSLPWSMAVGLHMEWCVCAICAPRPLPLKFCTHASPGSLPLRRHSQSQDGNVSICYWCLWSVPRNPPMALSSPLLSHVKEMSYVVSNWNATFNPYCKISGNNDG